MFRKYEELDAQADTKSKNAFQRFVDAHPRFAKAKKYIIGSCVVLVIGGVAYFFFKNKPVPQPVQEFMSNVQESTLSQVRVINYKTTDWPRSECVVKLQNGQNASFKKLKEAALKKIDVPPGYTYRSGTTCHRKAS